MKLTKKNIDRLYQFTRQHYVEWYDLQTELVDHLANDIEAIVNENPSLTFEEALQRSFKKFGVFGFSEVVEKRTTALSRKYWKLVFKYIKEYFRVPKIALTLFLIATYYTVFTLMPDKIIFIAISLGALSIIPFFFGIKIFLENKRIQKKTGKKYLYQNIVSTLGGLLFVPQLFIQLTSFSKYVEWTTTIRILFSFAVILFSILFYVAIKIIPKKLAENFTKQYQDSELLNKA
ncbi:MAG: hypothetical protein KDC69_07205 [Flavobacteriaceae bacterium]|nr:hypothetical protein [Flavobacteriaceae bacterium]